MSESSSNNNNNSLQLPTANTHHNHAETSSTATAQPPTMEVPRVEDMAKKEKTMAEFLAMMDNYAPIVSHLNDPCMICLLIWFL